MLRGIGLQTTISPTITFAFLPFELSDLCRYPWAFESTLDGFVCDVAHFLVFVDFFFTLAKVCFINGRLRLFDSTLTEACGVGRSR